MKRGVDLRYVLVLRSCSRALRLKHLQSTVLFQAAAKILRAQLENVGQPPH